MLLKNCPSETLKSTNTIFIAIALYNYHKGTTIRRMRIKQGSSDKDLHKKGKVKPDLYTCTTMVKITGTNDCTECQRNNIETLQKLLKYSQECKQLIIFS